MADYERIRKEALLDGQEIRSANVRVLKRHGFNLPQTLEDYLKVDELERLKIIEEQQKEQLQAQIDKVLKTKGVRIEADDQNLPESCYGLIEYPELMRKSIDEKGFIKVLPERKVNMEADKLEDLLVQRLCKRNGWEYGGGDYDLAVEDLRWFLSQPEISFKAGVEKVMKWVEGHSRNWDAASFNDHYLGRSPTTMRTAEFTESEWVAFKESIKEGK